MKTHRSRRDWAERSCRPSCKLLLAVLIFGLFSNGTGANSLRHQKPHNVCISDWEPFVSCSVEHDPSHYDGYMVALWRHIAEDLGWHDEDWFFSCVEWTAMMDDLASPNGNCSIAPAGVEVIWENIALGLRFSWPVYKAGFAVLIASTVQQGGTWAFSEAFDWSVWTALGLTALAVSVIITVAEKLADGDTAKRKGLRGWYWYCTAKTLQVTPHVGDPNTWGSRVLVMGYGFLVLIMTHLYTAGTASNITKQKLANDIKGKIDLPGKRVETWGPFQPLLRKYSIDADALPWETREDDARLLDNLRTHKYQALILDSPSLQFYAANAEDCGLFVVGDAFETYNLAIAFPPDVNNSLAAEVSASIIRLQSTNALLDKLDNDYIKGGSSGHGTGGASGHGCASTHALANKHSNTVQLHLQQISGLLYIVAMSFGAALLVMMSQNLRRSPSFRQRVINFLLWRWGQLRTHPLDNSVSTSEAGSAAAATIEGGEHFMPGPDGQVKWHGVCEVSLATVLEETKEAGGDKTGRVVTTMAPPDLLPGAVTARATSSEPGSQLQTEQP